MKLNRTLMLMPVAVIVSGQGIQIPAPNLASNVVPATFGKANVPSAFTEIAVAKSVQVPKSAVERAMGSGPLVIASVGESYAAGEGSPNRRDNNVANVRWQKLGVIFKDGQLVNADSADSDSDRSGRQCHHSAFNGRAKSAVELDTISGVNVLFVSFACSGATINEGLLGRYGGVEPNLNNPQTGRARGDMLPQMDQLQQWLDAQPLLQRRLDVLLISVGGNDLGFGQAVPTCLNPLQLACHEDRLLLSTVANGRPGGAGGVVGQIGIRAAYDALAERITQLNPRPRFVMITSYPDLVRDGNGDFCDSEDVDNGFKVGENLKPGGAFFGLIGGSMANISRDESRYLSETLLTILNGAPRAWVQRMNDPANAISRDSGIRFLFLDGMRDLTRHHGFCANDRWFNTFKDSFDRQGDIFGTAHPNGKGHDAYKHLITKGIVENLQLPDAPSIEVFQPTVSPVFVSLPSSPFTDQAWRIQVEIPPTAHDLEVTLQWSINESNGTAMFNPLSQTMTKRQDAGIRNVYELTIPGSQDLGAADHFHFRVFIRYALPGRVKTKFFVGQTHRAQIPFSF